VASFDGGYGSALPGADGGQKRAREIFFVGRELHGRRGVPDGHGERQVCRTRSWRREALAGRGEITAKSPTAIRMLKYAFNLTDDGLVGQQLFAGEATRLAYGTEEAKEGRDAFLEKRPQDYKKFPWQY
jgi:naphthoate synthase